MEATIISLLLLSFTLLNVTNSLEAQVNIQEKENAISYVKHYKNACFSGHLVQVDSMRILFWKNYLFGFDGVEDFVVEPGKNDFFNFTFDSLINPGKITFEVYNNGDHHILKNYIVEPGDSIYILVRRENGNFTVTFSGRGNLKYLVKSDVDLEYDRFDIQRRILQKTVYSSTKKLSNLKYVLSPYITGEAAMLRSIDKYKSRLSPLIYQILKADAKADIEKYFHFELNTFYNNAPNDTQKNKVIYEYFKNRKSIEEFPEKVLELSPSYVEYILQKSLIDLRFYNRKRNKDFYTIKEIYIFLKTNFKGKLRERLLLTLLVIPTNRLGDYSEQTDYFDCISDAYSLIKTPFFAERLNQLNVYKKGTDAFSFSLPDTLGQMVHLHELRNKVILIDMWFTGCSGCALFFKRFETKIYPKINKKDNFRVVSISTDTDKTKWLKSIASAKYTNSTHINLYTTGQGVEHPIVKYYVLNGMPSLILIDKSGKIYSQILLSMSDETIISLINEALNN